MAADIIVLRYRLWTLSFKPLLFTPIYFYPTFATAGAVSRIFEFFEFFELAPRKPSALVIVPPTVRRPYWGPEYSGGVLPGPVDWVLPYWSTKPPPKKGGGNYRT